MLKLVVAIGVLVATGIAVGCGAGSPKSARDCFVAWNAKSNKPRQAMVARRFTVAAVRQWRAQPAGSGAVDASASVGCGYLFHSSKRYLSISGEWKGGGLRWGVPPTVHGSWSAPQQAAVDDNATVDAAGFLSH